MAINDDVTPPTTAGQEPAVPEQAASGTSSRIGWSGAQHLTPNHRDRPHLRRDPLRVYATRAVIWDIVAVTAASAIGFILRWTIPYNLDISDGTYVFFAAVVVLSWISVLVLRGAYDTRILGVGSEEFKRIVGASALVFAAIAIVSFALKLDLSRGFVLITFAVGMVLLLTVRWVLRAWLRHERMYGHFLHRTIVIGSGNAQTEIVDMLDRDPVAGFTVVDVIDEPPVEVSDTELDLWLDEVMARISLEDADTVAVAGSRALEHTVVQKLAWRLEGPRVDLMVAPNVGDIAGPRVSMRMAADLPLLHLDEPHLTGPKRAIKRTLDIVFGIVLFVVFLPFMIVAGIGTFVSSKGPIFYSQQRVGRGGEMITVTKFRTMYVGADKERDKVIGSPDEKIFERYKADPRITPFGRILRRWSIE
ncbi:MAG TPA: sugar transferase, partial [Candidatus Nanopelagicales bacterium]|nr:sugar transferase [Candidatus Nanopelagicales bacterium]